MRRGNRAFGSKATIFRSPPLFVAFAALCQSLMGRGNRASGSKATIFRSPPLFVAFSAFCAPQLSTEGGAELIKATIFPIPALICCLFDLLRSTALGRRLSGTHKGNNFS